MFHFCTHAIPLSCIFRFSLRTEDRGRGLISQGRRSKGEFLFLLFVFTLPKSNDIAPLLLQYRRGYGNTSIGKERQAVTLEQEAMSGITEQGDAEGEVCFHDFLFDSVQILTCYCFFSAGPTSGPDSAGVRALKLTLTHERRREAGEGWKGKGYGK